MSIIPSSNLNGRPAGFWLRLAAHLVDNFIVHLIALVAVFIALLTVLSSRVQDLAAQDNSLFGWIYLLLVLLYKAGFEASSMQATPGKHVVGIVVVNRHSQRVSFFRAFLRNAFKGLSYIIFGLGFLMAALPGSKRCLHDVLSGAFVIRREKLQ